MSARDRLIEAGISLSIKRARDEEPPMPNGLFDVSLDAFLARPDDLLAVMVEAGVLERVDGVEAYRMWQRQAEAPTVNSGNPPVYRRTEEAK